MSFAKIQRGIAWGLLAAMVAFFAWAIWGTFNPPQLRGADMATVFAGHTVVGHWNGEPYAQYFDPSGEFVVAAGDEPPATGRWWVAQPDLLCFEIPQWEARRCGTVWLDGNALMLFEEGSGRAHPATLVLGRLVVDPPPSVP